jgi:hypothetical protein
MKTVIINLNIISIPQNTQPINIRPCPRVNVFQHPINPADITQVGNYNYSIELEDNGRCGVDVFAWKNNKININTNLSITSKPAGFKLDQIKKNINITEAGTYNISVSID